MLTTFFVNFADVRGFTINGFYQCSTKISGHINEDNLMPHIWRLGINVEDILTHNFPQQNLLPLTAAEKDQLRNLIRNVPFNHNEAMRLLRFGWKSSINMDMCGLPDD